MLECPSDILVTPGGKLTIRSAEPPPVWTSLEIGHRVSKALAESSAYGLLHLATRELNTLLPAAANWWREFGRRYLTALCHVPDLEQARQVAPITPPNEFELAATLETAPPAKGGEYLNVDLLRQLWLELDELVSEAIRLHPQGAAAWLKDSHPLWRMVGRVTFHLAENKSHPTHPFAFMASYAPRISSQSRVQHLPLGRALEEYGGANNKSALLNLLSPIQRAAEKSAFIKEWVDSGRIFKPLALTAGEAYRFLQNVPACEQGGVIVRLPDWWKGGRPPRPKVSVRIGQNRRAGLGADVMLDFSAKRTLDDGEPLTDQEWRGLMESAEGLVQIRGRWVEVNPDKLKEALTHWKKVEQMARSEGLTFFEGMRLLSGFNAGQDKQHNEVGQTEEKEWAGVQPGNWLEQVLAEMREPARISALHDIPGLQAQLRPYQAVGVNWLGFLASLGLGGCLADDMGLGKTIQVLGLILRRKSERKTESKPSILVVPASLLGNWRSEIEKFAPSIRFLIAHPSETGTPSALFEKDTDPSLDLVITTYGMVTRLEPLRKKTWDLAILDEAQAIKNPGAQQSRAVKELKAVARFALTGTPVENRASDLWSIFDYLNPGLLGSARAFQQFIRARDNAPQPDYAPLRSITQPYILRRLKTDKRVISDLPEKTEVRGWCSLTKPQAALYQKSVSELEQKLDQTEEGIQRKGLILAFIMRFKQICNHPSQWLNDGGYAPEASGKFARLREITEEIAERQEKALIFTQFQEMTDPLAGFLAGVFKRPGLVLHGGTSVPARRHMVEAFQKDEGPPFFILTVKAGGAGLNLTQAAHVIHFDRWWNPAVENQATDRAFRIGQRKNVLVHKFVCRGTIEERIDQVIEDKKSLSNELLEGGGEKLLTEMSNTELLSFVSLDLQRATAT